jgi:hypothetical protein
LPFGTVDRANLPVEHSSFQHTSMVIPGTSAAVPAIEYASRWNEGPHPMTVHTRSPFSSEPEPEFEEQDAAAAVASNENTVVRSDLMSIDPSAWA